MAFPNPPYPFANLGAGNQPIAYLDTMYAALGNASVIACTAAGTNAITLTPNANFFLPTVYTNYTNFAFAAINTSTGAVTIQVAGLSALNLYMPSGTQASSGDIVSGSYYQIVYNSALNLGAGGFQVLNATVSSVAQPVKSSYSNLKITNNAVTPNTKVNVTADAAVLQNASGGTVRVTTVSVTIDFSVNGANGLDTGSIASGLKDYFIYLIYNATTSTTAGLASTNSTTPTLPAGYTYFARFGVVKSANGSAQLLGSIQYGNRAQYVAGLGQGIPGNFATGVSGTYSATSPTLSAANISGVGGAIPATSVAAYINVSNKSAGGTTANVLVAPNTSWGGTNNGPTGSNAQTWPCWLISTVTSSVQIRIELEVGSVAWASDNAGAMFAMGWEDNL